MTDKQTGVTELYDEKFEEEIRLNKRTFHLNLLDKTDINER